MKEITAYQTIDGKLHDSEKAARLHEAAIALQRSFIDEWSALRGLEYEDVIFWMRQNVKLARDMVNHAADIEASKEPDQ